MKPGAYSQVYLQLVFSPKGRQALLTPDITERVFGFIGQTILNRKCKPYIINGMPDHIHIMAGLNPSISISDLVHDIKRTSSLFINENNLTKKHFQWQEGYGVFSYGRSQREMIYKYILNQQRHHHKVNFRREFIRCLESHGIPFEERFLFDFLD
jgi:putative transposase